MIPPLSHCTPWQTSLINHSLLLLIVSKGSQYQSIPDLQDRTYFPHLPEEALLRGAAHSRERQTGVGASRPPSLQCSFQQCSLMGICPESSTAGHTVQTQLPCPVEALSQLAGPAAQRGQQHSLAASSVSPAGRRGGFAPALISITLSAG